VSTVVLPSYYKATRIFFVRQNNDFLTISSDGRFQNTASERYESFVSNQ